jgi:hypothetical protein
LAGLGWSQAPDTDHTLGVVNGHWWLNKASDGIKLGYLIAWSETTLEKDIPPKATFSDIVQAVDEFYSHPENRAVTVRGALEIFNMKVRGGSAECVEAATESHRALTGILSDKNRSYLAASAREKRLCGEPATVKTPAR